MSKTSEFGEGCVYSLVLFANHFDGHFTDTIHWAGKYLTIPEAEREAWAAVDRGDRLPREEFRWWLHEIVPIYGSVENALSERITLWANGATDHLYGLRLPWYLRWTKLAGRVQKLRDTGLAMGHGFGSRVWTYQDFLDLQKLTKEVAMGLDRWILANPIKADWE